MPESPLELAPSLSPSLLSFPRVASYTTPPNQSPIKPPAIAPAGPPTNAPTPPIAAPSAAPPIPPNQDPNVPPAALNAALAGGSPKIVVKITKSIKAPTPNGILFINLPAPVL